MSAIPSLYPLTWPVGPTRTPDSQRKSGPNQMPAGKIRQQLAHELKMLGVSDAVVSTNVAMRRDGLPYANQRTDDPGVVLFFTRKGEETAMACDSWRTVDANLRAIGLNIEATRGMERWGVNDAVDKAFRGYKALPETAVVTPYAARSWYEILEVVKTASPEIVRAAYRAKAAKVHPDAGGSVAAFQEVQDAYKQGIEASS